MKKILTLLLIISLTISVFTSCKKEEVNEDQTLKNRVTETLSSKIRLSFDEEGDFRILVIADVHARGELPEMVSENIKELVDEEDPSLVIFTGDNTICSTEDELKASLNTMVGYIEEKQIPWCHVYGNHDDESGLTKEEQQSIYESYEYCISKSGDESLSGVGNYVLPVYKNESEDIGFLVWCLDSGAYLSDSDKNSMLPFTGVTDYQGMPESPYDYIKADQINWYYNTSLDIERYYGEKINSVMAFHIPLQETYYAWENRGDLTYTGEKNDFVGASMINSGLFYSLLSRQDVKAVVNGHDHTNDFMVEYAGIKLCYAPTVSTVDYYQFNLIGGRVFKINQDNTDNVETYVNHLFG